MRKSRNLFFRGYLLLALITALSSARAQIPDFPTLRIPKMTRPPTLDGEIHPDEWSQAAALTGLTSDNLGGGLLPNIQQVTFYLGYDDRHIYLAMHSPNPRGLLPKAHCKQNEVDALLFEDHIEWQILKYARELATRPGFGFYKMVVNPYGAYDDQWYYNGTPGSERLWRTGGTTKCSVTPARWDLEMSVDIAHLGETSLDGKDWVMQLVRADAATGSYFAGWGPGYWLAWNKFPRVIFDPSAVALQLTSLGDLMEGNLDAQFALSSNDTSSKSVSINFAITDAAGNVLFDQTKTVDVSASAPAQVHFTQSGLALSDKGNHFTILARQGDKILYQITTPITKLTAQYRKKYLDPWLNQRPRTGDWDYTFAYQPYSNVAECSVDLDQLGLPENLLKADQIRVDVSSSDGTNITSQQAPITNLTARMIEKLPPLSEGHYRATFFLMSLGKEIASKQLEFVRKYYPWEHNTIGISSEVIPPFEPIRTRKDSNDVMLHFWARDYHINPSGLPGKIDVALKSLGMQYPLLRNPARIEIVRDGKSIPAEDASLKLISAADDQVRLAASQRFGPIQATTAATAEYDGWYEVNLTLASQDKLPVDHVDLVLDLPAETDTLYVHRAGDSRVGNYFGALPQGRGIVWESKSLPSFQQFGKDWKSFVPVVFAGTGSRGLWFYSWSDAGWQLSDNDSTARVERDANGLPTLRFRLVSGGADLSKPRTITFALLAAPVKPLPDNYRVWRMTHDTAGFRYYGDSVDGFSLPDSESYEALRKTLLYGPSDPKAARERPYLGRGRGDAMTEGIPNVLYGSTWMTGLGMEEFDTFGGEWLGKTNWSPIPELKFSGKSNYSGSVVWKTPRQLSPMVMNFTHSFLDAFVWYHRQLINAGVNGTWFDNCSIGTIRQYNPSTGAMECVFNQKIRRELTKRLSTACWEAMRPPCWLSNLHEDISFTQCCWMVENDWYIPGKGMDFLDEMSVDQFRAMACTKTMQLPTSPWLVGGSDKDLPPEVNDHIERTKWGICLLHDVGCATTDPLPIKFPPSLLRELNYLVDYDSAANCAFRGYWDTPGSMLKYTVADTVKASIYSCTNRPAAVIVLLNTADAVQISDMALSSSLLNGAPIKRAFDIETGADLKIVPDNDRWLVKTPITFGHHAVRLIAVTG